jgi:hypothetical protein
MPPKIAGSGRTCLRTAILCALLANTVLWLLAPLAPAQTSEATVSLNVKNMPLSEVLAQITIATGTDFIIDSSWQKLQVTALVDDVPLPVALKRVLNQVNHAIIYRSQNRIEILIYQAEKPSAPPTPPRQTIEKTHQKMGPSTGQGMTEPEQTRPRGKSSKQAHQSGAKGSQATDNAQQPDATAVQSTDAPKAAKPQSPSAPWKRRPNTGGSPDLQDGNSNQESP